MRMLNRNDDSGFTLIEVMAAMMVLAIIATGFLYVLTSGLKMSRDTRARVVAANLASQEIDLARSRASVFDVTNSTRSVTLNGDNFQVAVTTSWALSSGASATCQSGDAGGAIEYKEIAVKVTWDGMGSAAPVYADTSLAPRTKINDPTLGSILVGVIDSAGQGVSGATVSVSPANTAAVTTDRDGCAYLLKVPPGTYTVSVSKSGYISEQQLTSPSATAVVTAGGGSRLSFAYDQAARFQTTYGDGGAKLPTNLDTAMISTYGTSLVTSTAATNPKTISAFPISSGYVLLAGAYADAAADGSAGCLAPDPGAWTATTDLVGARPAAFAAPPGTSATAAVPMATVTLSYSSLTSANRYLRAVYVGGGSGDPGCTNGMEYQFGQVLTGTSVAVALPYGTWEFYRGTSTSMTTKFTSGISVTAPSNVVSTSKAVLDPRVKP